MGAPGAGPEEAICRTPAGCIELISTGASSLDSSLLGASADGTDVYFFTHATLVSGDQNGARVKIYDARAGGGFPQLPPPVPCKASDECHGPGSPAPPSPNITTIDPTPHGNAPLSPGECKKGFVNRHGSCVRAHKSKHHRHRRKGQRHG